MPGPGTGKAPPAIASDAGGGKATGEGERARRAPSMDGHRHRRRARTASAGFSGLGSAGSVHESLLPPPSFPWRGLAAVPGPGQPGQGCSSLSLRQG